MRLANSDLISNTLASVTGGGGAGASLRLPAPASLRNRCQPFMGARSSRQFLDSVRLGRLDRLGRRGLVALLHLLQQRIVEALDQVGVRDVAAQVLGLFVRDARLVPVGTASRLAKTPARRAIEQGARLPCAARARAGRTFVPAG